MSPQKGTIQWFLANMPPDSNGESVSRPFKKPRLQPEQKQQPCRPHLALRSSNHCQQLLVQELGWRCTPSINSWHAAQQQQLSCLCLRAAPEPNGFRTIGSRSCRITCLEIQQQPSSSSSNSSRLVAVVDSHDSLHICSLSRLRAASESALNAAAALPADVRDALLDTSRWARKAQAQGVPVGSGCIPSAAVAGPSSTGVLRVDSNEQLRSCCWLQQQHNGAAAASSSEGVLVSSGRSGLVKRVFAQGRQATSSLRAKGGNMVEAAGTVVSLEAQAAYQLAAVSGRSLLLWDLRAGPAAAAQLPVPASPSMLRALPGGQLLLTAEPNGQVCLYDVRRLSSSSIVNFGSSRGSQQLLLAHNLKARAQAAGYSSSSGSLLYGVAHEPHFLSDVVLNPADSNLLAYIKPQLQAGLFDLYSGKVLQQVPLLDARPDTTNTTTAAASNNTHSSPPPDTSVGPLAQAGWHCCWDASGKVLYTQGLLQQGQGQQGPEGSTVPEATATLAAVDFGSWHGRRQRWCSQDSSGGDGCCQADDSAGAGARSEHTEGVCETAERSDGLMQDPAAVVAGMSESQCGRTQQRFPGRGRLCQGGQVLHRELHWGAAPTVLAAAGDCGEMVVGTLSGDLLWLG